MRKRSAGWARRYARSQREAARRAAPQRAARLRRQAAIAELRRRGEPTGREGFKRFCPPVGGPAL